MLFLALVGSVLFVILNQKKNKLGLRRLGWVMKRSYMYTDGFDGSKWVCCNACRKYFYLSCATSDTEQQVEASKNKR